MVVYSSVLGIKSPVFPGKFSRRKAHMGRLGPGLGTLLTSFWCVLREERPFCNRKLFKSLSDTNVSSKMPKFLSQKRKKRKFYGNRYTNSLKINCGVLLDEESTSSEPQRSLTLDDFEETDPEPSASYRKLQSEIHEAKPKKNWTRKKGKMPNQTLRDSDSLIWKY